MIFVLNCSYATFAQRESKYNGDVVRKYANGSCKYFNIRYKIYKERYNNYLDFLLC